MGIQEAFNSIQKNINFYSTIGETVTSVKLCVLNKIYPHDLTADIFIPKTSERLFNVPILFPYLNANSGTIVMPSEKSAALVIFTSDAKPFIISSVNKFSDEAPNFVLNDENIMFSSSKAMLKQDIAGNQISMSGSGSLNVLTKNNEIKNYSAGKTFKTIMSKTISGITNIPISDKGTDVRALEYSKYYGILKKSKIYSKDDLIVIDENNHILGIDEERKSEILSFMDSMISNISTLFDEIDNFKKSIFDNPYMSKEEVENKVSEIKTKLYNKYSISKTSTLTIEKGIAINKDISDSHDLNNLTVDDIVLSDDGNNIVFRLKVSNSEGNDVAILTFDEEGNVKLKCKDFKVENL